MTTTLSRGRNEARSVYTVHRLRNPDEIRPFLEADRAYAAYAIAQLQPDLFDKSDWYSAIGPE